MWENLDKTRPDSAHYSIMRCIPNVGGMSALRGMFPDAKSDEMNFVLFSTSGVHGTYNTIEAAERFLKGDDDEGFADVTFVIVHPRLVAMRYGVCNPTNQGDIDYLKSLRASSHKIVSGIGVETPNAPTYKQNAFEGVAMTNDNKQPDVREAFEAHQLSRYQYADITRDADGRYCNVPMESEWETWQAALQSPSVANEGCKGLMNACRLAGLDLDMYHTIKAYLPISVPPQQQEQSGEFCTMCKGQTGWEQQNFYGDSEIEPSWINCPRCNGTGEEPASPPSPESQAAPQPLKEGEKVAGEIKRALYEHLEIAISHAKVSEDPFEFMCKQIRAMFDTEFSIRKRTPQPVAQDDSELNRLDDGDDAWFHDPDMGAR